MKKVFYIVFLLICTGCAKENRWDCFKSLGDERIENRKLDSFSKVFVEDRVDIEYYHSENYRVEVIFGENIIDLIKTKVENEELTISNSSTCNFVRDLSKHPVVKIYAPTFNYLENRCSGDITFRDTLRSSSFTYEQWESNGVATFLLKNELTKITMHVGFCEVIVKGHTDQSELYSAAVGKLQAENLISPQAFVNNTSIQDIAVYAENYLYGEVNDRGNIKYGGDPINIEKVLNGEGNLIPL
ncbi:MAG: DUF2807 domain-containing protein [Flavobacteriales bacterium]|nr:DUF2807 domain-containing protein [Flavobacteriales bacterium]